MQYLIYSNILFDLVSVENLPKEIQENDVIIFKNEENKQESGKIINVAKDDSIDLNKKFRQWFFIRVTTPHDDQIINQNKRLQGNLIKIAQEASNKLKLGVKIITANYSFDNNKVYVVFSSEQRVDFRELVKLLITDYGKPVHMQQIWPRDRARIVGYLGKCGLTLCCKKKNGQLPSITMATAKSQGLFWGGNTKFLGRCNKLMCCLEYEEGTYKELSKELPRVGSTIQFKKKDIKVNKGKVVNLNVLNQQIFVEINFFNDDGRKVYRKIIIDKDDMIE